MISVITTLFILAFVTLSHGAPIVELPSPEFPASTTEDLINRDARLAAYRWLPGRYQSGSTACQQLLLFTTEAGDAFLVSYSYAIEGMLCNRSPAFPTTADGAGLVVHLTLRKLPQCDHNICLECTKIITPKNGDCIKQKVWHQVEGNDLHLPLTQSLPCYEFASQSWLHVQESYP